MRRFLRIGACVATLCCGPALAQTDPKPIDPGTWVTADDYPAAALRNGESGQVRFELQIDRFGKPVACHIVESSHSASLDTVTCKTVMERGTFEPGRDAQGKPTQSVWRMRFNWALPTGVTVIHQPLTSFVQIEQWTFDGKGRLTNCTSRKAGELGYRMVGCLKDDKGYIIARFLTGRYRNTTLTITVAQRVEGDPLPPDAPTSDLAPSWTLEHRFKVNGDGTVGECTQRDSRTGTVPCDDLPRFLPAADGKPRQVTTETSWASVSK